MPKYNVSKSWYGESCSENVESDVKLDLESDGRGVKCTRVDRMRSALLFVISLEALVYLFEIDWKIFDSKRFALLKNMYLVMRNVEKRGNLVGYITSRLAGCPVPFSSQDSPVFDL